MSLPYSPEMLRVSPLTTHPHHTGLWFGGQMIGLGNDEISSLVTQSVITLYTIP